MCILYCTLSYITVFHLKHIGGVMVGVLASNAVDRGFEAN